MNTDITFQVESPDEGITEQLAEQIGAKLQGGEVFELVSDLGGGKTTFTRGLVRGAGSTDKVASPTFTLSRVYAAPHFNIVHFDFYRLEEPGIVAAELAEIIHDSEDVLVVEWGDIVHDVLPEKRFTVTIKQLGGDLRQIVMKYPIELAYLAQQGQKL